MSIGFTSPAPAPSAGAPESLLFRFDSGQGLTLEDLQRHLIVTGSTGSGKTASVGNPILAGMMKSGCALLITDQKGNFRDIARRLAWALGRQEDLIEFGSAPTATPLNLLAGMDDHQLSAFFEELTTKSFKGLTHNMDFHLRGIQHSASAARLLRLLHSFVPAIDLNLVTVAEMLFNKKLAQRLYAAFKENFYDAGNGEHNDLVATVEDDRFNFMFEPRDGKNYTSDGTRSEQINYCLSGHGQPAGASWTRRESPPISRPTERPASTCKSF